MLYIDTTLLPDKSDSLATKDEAEKVIAKYGNPTTINHDYGKHIIIEFRDVHGNFLDSLPIPKSCLFSGDSLRDLNAVYKEYHGYKLYVRPNFN